MMIKKALTHAQEVIAGQINLKSSAKLAQFQDQGYNDDGYPDYSDYSYIDATHW